MRFLARIIVAVVSNGVALYAASRFIPGFELQTVALKEFVIVAVTLTLLNFLVKPILKLILGPIIILTLGLGLILVNAIVLKILDFLSTDLTIHSIPALLSAGIVVGLVNFVFHLAEKN